MTPERVGRFRIEAELGSGGQAIVYLCREPDTGRRVALKVLHAESHFDDARIERFSCDAKLASLDRHHNVVRVPEIGGADGALPRRSFAWKI